MPAAKPMNVAARQTRRMVMTSPCGRMEAERQSVRCRSTPSYRETGRLQPLQLAGELAERKAHQKVQERNLGPGAERLESDGDDHQAGDASKLDNADRGSAEPL